jgi:RNA-directed DNA polymerase
LHYAFDAWMAREFPEVCFERYVDDVVVHCVSKRQAQYVLTAIAQRMDQVGLTLHPDKTRIVYCHDGRRRGCHEHTAFTFLGYTFRARGARNKNGKMFLSFLPAISKDVLAKISAQVRSWRLHHRTGRSFADLAREINPIVRGWMNYYGDFYKSALYCLLTRINAYLLRWVRNKVSTVTRTHKGPKGMDRGHPKIPSVLRPLGLGQHAPHCRMTRMTRAG